MNEGNQKMNSLTLLFRFFETDRKLQALQARPEERRSRVAENRLKRTLRSLCLELTTRGLLPDR